MNKKLLIGALVLLLLGGGAGGFFYLKPGGTKPAPTPTQQTTESVPVRVSFLAMPVVEKGQLDEYTILSVTIGTPSEADAQAVKNELPRVVDTLIDALHTAPDGTPLVDQPVDPAQLSNRLTRAVRAQPIGKHIRDVVISTDHPVPR